MIFCIGWSGVSSEHYSYGSAAAQHRVTPPDGILRVFRQSAWLEVDSSKATLPRRAHQRVMLTVRQDLELLES